jgi:hypothetical protein
MGGGRIGAAAMAGPAAFAGNASSAERSSTRRETVRNFVL